MSDTTKVLRLVFRDNGGNLKSVSIPNPVEEPTEVAITNAMDHIIDQDLFKPNFVTLISKIKAEIVERSVDNVYTA